MSLPSDTLLDEVIVGKSLPLEDRYRTGGATGEASTGTGFLDNEGIYLAKLQ